ncbi:hypothetical protein [Rhodovulum sp. FJ3]|uniref:hypothetical protein n=1 Tax=Rhodovulum sp. FJ3 TaxID=3079053 RepID=UPI00293DC39C|nr:hypothetical protein [Rhodovulum sp. FJ3]MDV4167800.1 hypothetical protein [Rhodovulum sp. FJ3]
MSDTGQAAKDRQIEVQAELIKALWADRAQTARTIAGMNARLDGMQKRLDGMDKKINGPTPREAAEAVFKG